MIKLAFDRIQFSRSKIVLTKIEQIGLNSLYGFNDLNQFYRQECKHRINK